jgi:glycosyltransferase involved in cell wall biosynthesis
MPSHSTQVEFLKHYGINLNRAPLVYPGMDLDRFRQLPERRQARAYLALSEDLPVVLYVGFSTPRKGVEHLAQAMRAIPSTQLLMVGKWEAGYQQRFMAALGESHSRTTLAGYVPESEMLWYYAAADVLVLPTLLEGVGLPSIEAMAAGLPVVTTTGGAAGEIVGPGGIAVTPADSVALAAAIDRVLGDSDLARQLGDAGRQRAFSLFDLAAASQRVETIYQRALEQGA